MTKAQIPATSDTVDTADTAVVIFAKYPREGKVKTRLAAGPVPGLGQLSLADCAALYRAFLRDYAMRFSRESFEVQGFFCLRPSPDFAAFGEEFTTPPLQLLEEPTHEGRAAQDIGQAMSFAIRGVLAQGFRKVLILGSDLPHFPASILEEAKALLDRHPLVLGDDGGGCYLVGACAPPVVLETGEIPWSQDRDFSAICQAQEEAGQSVGVLSLILEDIDEPASLGRLLEDVLQRPEVYACIPHTSDLLRQWHQTKQR